MAKIMAVSSMVGASLLLVGCASPPATMYQWEGYQPHVYEYLKDQGKGPDDQIMAMEQDFQKIRSGGRNPPPGFHAHLGLLYTQVGKQDLAVEEFRAEKQLFPESSVYMDSLLNKLKK